MQGTEHGLLIPRITESRRPVRDGMRFQELSSASSALNQVGVTGIPPLQGSLLLQAYARKDEIERSFDTTSKVVTRKLTPSSLTAHIVQQDGGVFVLQKMPSFSLPNVDLSERSRLRAGKTMNGLVIILIGIVALGAGYLFYGRWLAKKWGIDPNAKTPAYTHEDGEDYVPSSRFTVFSHQFSSIAGAGPVTGPILASVFGWVPVLLWLIIGGLFFGAVQDFGALYASVKNEGKSMGMIIEKYIGKTGRKLFMLFCWLFTLLVIAAFTDMVAGTFVGKGVDGMTAETSYANSAAASISMLFIVVAVVFGLIQKHVGKMNEVVKAVVAIALLVAMFAVGMALPICTTKSAWIYIVMAYLFLASVMPMWLLMQPRDYMTTFMRRISARHCLPCRCRRCRRKRNQTGRNSVRHLLLRRCRFPREAWSSGTGCYGLHDHVRLRACADIPGFRRTYRPYVLPGTILRRYNRSGKNVTGAARADKQIFCHGHHPVFRLSADTRRI